MAKGKAKANRSKGAMTRAEERDLMRARIQAQLDALEGVPSGDGRAFVGEQRQAACTLIARDQYLVHEARGAHDPVQVRHRARLRGFSELYADVTGQPQSQADVWLHKILVAYSDPVAAPSAESTGRKLRDAAGERARSAARARGDAEPWIEWERVRLGGAPHVDLTSISSRCVVSNGSPKLSGLMIGEALVEYLKHFKKVKS